MKGEEAKKVWSKDQMLLISALHMFSVSYFTGSIKITTKEEPEAAAANPPAKAATGPVPVSKNGQPAEPATADPPGTETEVVAPKRPTCSPEQKVKVTNAINAYVAANAVDARPRPGRQDAPGGQDAGPAQAAPPPHRPTGGSN